MMSKRVVQRQMMGVMPVLPYLFLAGASDVVDFMGAFIPIIGDVIDAATTFILYKGIGYYAFIGLTELLPVVVTDFFPTHTVAVLLYMFAGGMRR